MHVYTDVATMKADLAEVRRQGRSIGFVPTMGALHQGHLKLVAESRAENDFTVCSIYVNPTQFNDPKDLEKYPRDIAQDQAMLEEVGCDALFLPSDVIMYARPTVIRMNFGYLETVMEGEHRPGHFQGVGLVVSKLLHLVGPDRAYFGQKDLQQFAVIRQMVEDLMFPVEVVRVPIVREKDGLAMSSRNGRLGVEERARSVKLFQCLQQAREDLLAGKSVTAVKNWVADELTRSQGIALEYFEVVHSDTLQVQSELSGDIPTSLCIAAWVGDIRLIDNLSV